MSPSKWDQRIARAQTLAEAHRFAAEVLSFYARLAGIQKELYLHLERHSDNLASPPTNGRLSSEINLDVLLPKFGEFVSHIATLMPDALARSAQSLQTQDAESWKRLLISHWQNAPHFEPTSGDAEALIVWMFLEPYAEYLADQSQPRLTNGSLALCPVCSARPLVGVLRPEGDGAKRSLICSVCATEWPYRRIVCPACGEESVEKLAVYTADQFSYVRVEACDSCRYYIKTIDLTKNGHAVPIVDELATIPLNLWAQEHDYAKLRRNLLGI